MKRMESDESHDSDWREELSSRIDTSKIKLNPREAVDLSNPPVPR